MFGVSPPLRLRSMPIRKPIFILRGGRAQPAMGPLMLHIGPMSEPSGSSLKVRPAVPNRLMTTDRGWPSAVWLGAFPKKQALEHFKGCLSDIAVELCRCRPLVSIGGKGTGTQI